MVPERGTPCKILSSAAHLALSSSRSYSPAIPKTPLPKTKLPRRSGSSAGVLMYRGTGPGLEVLLVHPGGHSGATKTTGFGLFQKARSKTARMPPLLPDANSWRRPASPFRVRLNPWAKSASVAARGSSRSPSRAILMQPPSRATRSKSSGLRRGERCNHFRKSIVPNGSICPLPPLRYLRANDRCSIGWPVSQPSLGSHD